MGFSYWFIIASALFVVGMVLVMGPVVTGESMVFAYVGLFLLLIGYLMVLVANYMRYMDFT